MSFQLNEHEQLNIVKLMNLVLVNSSLHIYKCITSFFSKYKLLHKYFLRIYSKQGKCPSYLPADVRILESANRTNLFQGLSNKIGQWAN